MAYVWLTLAALIAVGLWRLRSRRAGVSDRSTRPILIDGSNVMYWKNETPDLEVVRNLVAALEENGHPAGVVFDANVGYKIGDRYMNDAALADLLGVSVEQVLVSPKGTPADRFLLQASRDMDAPIVSNDRFRDWADEFPEITSPARLIRGGFRDGNLSLYADQPEAS